MTIESSFGSANNTGLVDHSLRRDYRIISAVAERLPEIRYTGRYMEDLLRIANNMEHLLMISGVDSSSALLELYRTEHDLPDATPADLLAALEGTAAVNPFEHWKSLDESRSGSTINDYYAAFTGPQGDSAYTVWKNAQAEGAPNTQADYFAAIKGEPGNTLDLSGYATTAALSAALIPYATDSALQTGLAGKVTKDTYDEQRAALSTEDARIDGKVDMNFAKLGELADSIEALQEFPHLSQSQINLNAASREANRVQGTTNAADIASERAAREAADNALEQTISTAQNTADRKQDAAQVDQRADARIAASIASGSIKELFNTFVPEGALVLEDLAQGTVCGLSGTGSVEVFAQESVSINLQCAEEITKTIVGKVNLVYSGEGSIDNGEAILHVGDRQYNPRVGEFDSVVINAGESISIEGNASRSGAISVNGTITFDGQAVGSVEAIARKVTPNLTPSVLQTHSATIAQQHPMTAFTVNTGNNPLSTDVFTVPTKDASNTALSAINDGELVKFEVPFYFDTQTHEGFPPECSLVVKADGIVIKTYNYDNNNLLSPDQLNILTFYAGKGETLTFEPTVATSRFGDGTIAITVYPYFDLIQVTQLGVLYNASKALAESVVAVQAAKQRLVDNAQDAQIGVLGEGTQALRDEYETTVAKLEALETRLTNPGYAALDRATVSKPIHTVTTSTTRTPLGDEWNAALEKGESPYMPVILFDMVSGGASPSSSSALDFVYVRDSQVFVNVLSENIPEVPERTVAGQVTRGNTIVSADNPLQISLGQDGHHRQTSLTLTPDPNNLPADGAEFHVDFHAVVGNNNRALYESNIVWGNGIPVQKEATNENGESVLVNSFQQGNQVIVQINETGAESLPIAGGYLSLYAHYDYVIPSVPAVPSVPTEVKIGDQVDGHFVVLLETGAGSSGSSRPVRVHYGNGQFIDTNRSASLIEFYTNNDNNIGNIYSTDYREDRVWDLSQLQTNAEAGSADFGFFSTITTDHTSNNLQLDVGLEVPNPDDANEPIDVGKEIADLKKNSGGGGTDIITFSDNAEIVGAHREFGGGTKYETVIRDIAASDIADGGKTIAIADGVVFTGYSGEVVTANSTPATITIRGGKSIPNTNEDGSYTIDLAEAGATIAHTFGIARADKTNIITLSGVAGTIDPTTVLRLSLRIRQTVPTGVMPPQRTASTNAGGGGATDSIKRKRVILTGNGVEPANMPEGAVFGGDISIKNLPGTGLTSATDEFVGYGARVIVPCANAATLRFRSNDVINEPFLAIDLTLTDKNQQSVIGEINDTSSAGWWLYEVTGEVSPACQVMFSVAYRTIDVIGSLE